MGGEKEVVALATRRPVGSPPRGRGKAILGGFPAGHVGITPAWAGKRPPLAEGEGQGEDHPRVGGEKPLHLGYLVLGVGSPPRGRGKVTHPRLKKGTDRITPAWAGKSHRGLGADPVGQDHPRVGGEKCQLHEKTCFKAGSPPRGRGKVSQSHNAAPSPRITPAWAGKSVLPPIKRSR